jgi:hypothetical protein
MNKFIGDLITQLKERQLEIGIALANGTPMTWEAYQRMVGINAGLQEALDYIEKQLEEDKRDDNI